jgi:hypothetical protein
MLPGSSNGACRAIAQMISSAVSAIMQISSV